VATKNELLKKFHNQKSNAKRRGIEWHLTFPEWVEWWGKDIDKRGSGHDKLQMQRFGDLGPYALGNIKKGFPMENSATWSKRAATNKANRAKIAHEKFLDALMFAQSKEPRDEELTGMYELQKDIHSGAVPTNLEFGHGAVVK
jgi:hypothetical protein